MAKFPALAFGWMRSRFKLQGARKFSGTENALSKVCVKGGSMKFLAYLFVALLGYNIPSFALDFAADDVPNMSNMVNNARSLPGTIVVRHNRESNRLEVLHSRERLSGNLATVNSLASRSFVAVELNKPQRGELDRDTSRSSWFFSLGINPFFSLNLGYGPAAYYTPTYYYSGYAYNYMPYYYYYYGYAPYNYYFYRWY